MDTWFEIFNFENTIKDYEYTRKAARNLYLFLDKKEFYENEAKVIADYILKRMQIVSFKDYLKRYIYEKANIRIPFYEVSDQIYEDIIIESFKENSVPKSWNPTTKRWSATAKAWLSSNSVRRKTVFLIGFGLNMPKNDVSEFLTKAIKEQDFNLDDPEEVVFFYCFSHRFSFQKAQNLLESYKDFAPSNNKVQNIKEESWDNDDELINYLYFLKSGAIKTRATAFEEFHSLLEEVKKEIKYMYGESPAADMEYRKKDKISLMDVERVICCGIPIDSKQNLKNSSSSSLSSYFEKYRMSRQHLDGVAKGQHPVERYDIITFKFFILSRIMEEAPPVERFHDFVEETNEVLKECGMGALYPVNPYEAFLMACILSDDPLGAYADVWTQSYNAE